MGFATDSLSPSVSLASSATAAAPFRLAAIGVDADFGEV